eukprot:5871459-Amphidinium_carterae.1
MAPQNLLARTAARAGFANADEYVSAIQDAAWGGMPDLLLWAQLLGLTATVTIDKELHTIGRGGPHLELADKHFVVVASTPQCQWRRLTGIISRKAQRIPSYLDHKARRASAPEQYRVFSLDGTELTVEGVDSAHLSSNRRGGMRRALEPDQDDEERIDQRAHLATLRSQQPDAYARALRMVCTAITQVLGVTVGHFFVPHAPLVEFVTTQTPRSTRPFTVLWLEDLSTGAIVLDALLRLAFRFGYVIQYVSLEETPPRAGAWMWPTPPNPFSTAWASHSTTHVVVVEADLRAMLIVSRYDYDLLIADTPADQRGGDPTYRPNRAPTGTNWYREADGLRVANQLRLRQARREARPLFMVPLLRAPVEDYAIASDIVRLSIMCLVGITADFFLCQDHLAVLEVGRPLSISRGPLFAMPVCTTTRVVLVDMLTRAAH